MTLSGALRVSSHNKLLIREQSALKVRAAIMMVSVMAQGWPGFSPRAHDTRVSFAFCGCKATSN